MKIRTVVGDIPVGQVSVRGNDYLTGTTFESRTYMMGSGEDSQDFFFNFRSIQEIDNFLQPFIEVKEQLKKHITEISIPSSVPRARWKGAGMGDYECTNCWEITSGGDELDTCPYCGAFMK